jgi:hypothetical protein
MGEMYEVVTIEGAWEAVTVELTTWEVGRVPRGGMLASIMALSTSDWLSWAAFSSVRRRREESRHSKKEKRK